MFVPSGLGSVSDSADPIPQKIGAASSRRRALPNRHPSSGFPTSAKNLKPPCCSGGEAPPPKPRRLRNLRGQSSLDVGIEAACARSPNSAPNEQRESHNGQRPDIEHGGCRRRGTR